MAQFVAAKFSQEDMPTLFEPVGLPDLKPQEFVVVPRAGGEDIAFISGFEYKSSQQLELRREPYSRVIRRASEPEVEAWWTRKSEERRALLLAKEKSKELRLDIKITYARIEPKEGKLVLTFTSDSRVDFRALVRELNLILKIRVELWQIGVRDEARFIDGFGICGLQTCCSTWLKEFRPISIRMAKDQDITLPPSKLAGQCGRLLCCLSYEVDQYRKLSRAAFPKGATVKWDNKDVVIVDRNLIAGTYLITEGSGPLKTIKAEEIGEGVARIPDQMRKFGKQIREELEEGGEDIGVATADAEAPAEEAPRPAPAPAPPQNRPKPQRPQGGGQQRPAGGQQQNRPEKRGGRPQHQQRPPQQHQQRAPQEAASAEPGDATAAPQGEEGSKRPSRKRNRGRNRGGPRPEGQEGGGNEQRAEGGSPGGSPPDAQGGSPPANPGRPKKRRRH